MDGEISFVLTKMNNSENYILNTL